VYSYSGEFRRCIGGLLIINFPVGVTIYRLGQLVADNHNNFNITIVSQEGTYRVIRDTFGLHVSDHCLLFNVAMLGVPRYGFESRVKHAQVLDVLNGEKAVAIVPVCYR
jgi:hypothetical protein